MKKIKKADLAWAKAKLREITNDPSLTLAIYMDAAERERLSTMTAEEIFKEMKEQKDQDSDDLSPNP